MPNNTPPKPKDPQITLSTRISGMFSERERRLIQCVQKIESAGAMLDKCRNGVYPEDCLRESIDLKSARKECEGIIPLQAGQRFSKS